MSYAFGGDPPGVTQAYHYGLGSVGVLGSQVPSTGTSGPSPVYNDLTLPDDANKEYIWQVITPPVGVTSFITDEYGGFYLSAPAGTYTFVYRLYENNIDLGTATVTVQVGEGAGSSGTVVGSLDVALQAMRTIAADIGVAVQASAQVAASLSVYVSSDGSGAVFVPGNPEATWVGMYPRTWTVRRGQAVPLVKTAAEDVLYDIDCSRVLPPGVTLVGVPAMMVSPVYAANPVTFSTPVINPDPVTYPTHVAPAGTVVQVRIGGGLARVPYTIYKVRMAGLTSRDDTWESIVELRVSDEA